MKVSIIGIGLIGGSLALDLRSTAFATAVFGVDKSESHLQKAIELGIIDEAQSLEEACKTADLIIIATPVNTAPDILVHVLDNCRATAVVMDVGSVKAAICQRAVQHAHRAQFVACHPIAGTEFSGPEAAVSKLFEGKINIICDAKNSGKNAIELVSSLFERIGSQNIFMDATTHDKHITYVSHLSHITSFALSLTVQALEKNDQNIFNMAGSGFDSTVRLAKSAADMWVPIFQANKAHMVEAIGTYISQLQSLKEMIESDDAEGLKASIKTANQIRKDL